VRRFVLKAKDNTFFGEGVEWFMGTVAVCLVDAPYEAPKYLQFGSIAEVNGALGQAVYESYGLSNSTPFLRAEVTGQAVPPPRNFDRSGAIQGDRARIGAWPRSSTD
jgi:hypothetical protein